MIGIGRRDRIPVQVFVSDTLTGKQMDKADEDLTYLLLFDGVVTNYGYKSDSMGKAFTISAESVMNVFKTASVRILTSMDAVTNNQMAQQYQGSATSNSLMFPASLFMYGLGDAGTEANHPYDFLKNAIDFLMQDSQSPVTEFYASYFAAGKGLNMLNRIAKVPFFDTADDGVSWASSGYFPLLKALQKSEQTKLLHQMTQNGPGKQTIYSLLNYIVGSLEYEWSFFSAPRYSEEGQMVNTCLKPLMYEAFPPACNYLFRSHLASLNITENVIAPPTRICLRDLDSAWSRSLQQSGISTGSGKGLFDATTVFYWPNNGDNPETLKLIKAPPFEQYQSEEFCGPNLFETTAPPWMTYLHSENISGRKETAEALMQHIYHLKQHESRTATARVVFNPYITPGFPGVIYDVPTPGLPENLGIIGHVLSVTHNMSKQDISTSVDFGFIRTLKDDEATPIPTAVPEVSDEVTRNVTNVQKIYDSLLGTKNPAMDVAALRAESFGGDGTSDPQKSPAAAYKYIERNIMTKRQFIDFIGGELLPATGVITGDYFDNRWPGASYSLFSDYSQESMANVYRGA
jgi:hypothetical protein